MANEFSFLPSGGDDFFAQRESSIVNVATASVTLSRRNHANRIVTLNRAGGIAVTLPLAVGSGDMYRLIVGTTFTSDATISTSGGAVMTGNAMMAADGGNTVNMFEAASDTNTITFDGSTTGGLKGDSVELIDIAADTWWVRVVGAATGSEETPFSAES